MGLAAWLNTAWMLKCSVERGAFHRATCQVARTQERVLHAILRANRGTEFGVRYGFDRLEGPREYQERVPLSTYADYAEPIRRIAAGEVSVLTRAPVRLLEPTSGTTGGEKLIPYTATLRRQFQRAVAAWVADLFWHRPGVRRGRAYWSLSPALGGARRSVGGIPIGFEDDAAYLGDLEKAALRRLLVVPSALARIPDLEAFRYATLLCLLRAGDLTLVSIWNPTFLTALIAQLEEWQELLCADLQHGLFRPPGPVPETLTRTLSRRDPRRAVAVRSILRLHLPLAERLRALWPRLALISCWTDAGAARFLPELRAFFPAVEIQAKGLLATEGCVSFPLTDRPGAVLAIRSHFFEFAESNSPTRLQLAHQLDRGGRYSVVLTTGGGLYRYQLHDEVEVVGFENECPLLRFLGKRDRTSDLVGEKLSEPHVRAVLDRVFVTHGVTPCFALLVPVEGPPPRYRLYFQGDQAFHADPALQADLEAGLAENPYYRQAVGLGQLAPMEVEVLDPDQEPAWRVYERRCLVLGQKAGNIKPTALDPRPGWTEVFQPRAVQRR